MAMRGLWHEPLMSSRSVWEAIRVMRKHKRKAFLESRIPFLPGEEREVIFKAMREKEALCEEILEQDRQSDLTLAELDFARWGLTLWFEPLKGCFPEVHTTRGSSGKLAWIYVKRSEQCHVRAWRSLTIETAGWEDTPP